MIGEIDVVTYATWWQAGHELVDFSRTGYPGGCAILTDVLTKYSQEYVQPLVDDDSNTVPIDFISFRLSNILGCASRLAECSVMFLRDSQPDYDYFFWIMEAAIDAVNKTAPSGVELRWRASDGVVLVCDANDEEEAL